MLTYPQIDPVALSLGPVQIHWYGLMYLVGIGGAWWLASRRLARFEPSWSSDTLSDLVFWVALGVIAGGRLGYVLFYDMASYINDPSLVLQIWKGGMSFHGGLVGVLLAVLWFSRKHQVGFFRLMDFIAPLVPIGLGRGVSATSSMPSCGAGRPMCPGPWFSRPILHSWHVIRRSCISSPWKGWRCLPFSGCSHASRARLWP